MPIMLRRIFMRGTEARKRRLDIKGLKVISGDLPRRALALTPDWAKQPQDELLADWDLCASKQAPQPIAPLE